MAEKEQNVTLFNNPTLTLLEVKMKLQTAFRFIGRLFAPPRQNIKSTNPSSQAGPDFQAPPNKLRKKNQHYHLIRKVVEKRESLDLVSLLDTLPKAGCAALSFVCMSRCINAMTESQQNIREKPGKSIPKLTLTDSGPGKRGHGNCR